MYINIYIYIYIYIPTVGLCLGPYGGARGGGGFLGARHPCARTMPQQAKVHSVDCEGFVGPDSGVSRDQICTK